MSDLRPDRLSDDHLLELLMRVESTVAECVVALVQEPTPGLADCYHDALLMRDALNRDLRRRVGAMADWISLVLSDDGTDSGYNEG